MVALGGDGCTGSVSEDQSDTADLIRAARGKTVRRKLTMCGLFESVETARWVICDVLRKRCRRGAADTPIASIAFDLRMILIYERRRLDA